MTSESIVRIAEEVLSAAHRPMHYRELTKIIRQKRPLSGLTPVNTVCALLATDPRFKRVAEGTYALTAWKEYPVARFAKDIAYDILKSCKQPISLKELGEKILRERQFKGAPSGIAANAVRSDSRFDIDWNSGLVGLSEWKK